MAVKYFHRGTAATIPSNPAPLEKALNTIAGGSATSGLNSAYGIDLSGQTIAAGTWEGSVYASRNGGNVLVVVHRWSAAGSLQQILSKIWFTGSGSTDYPWTQAIGSDVVFGPGEWLVVIVSTSDPSGFHWWDHASSFTTSPDFVVSDPIEEATASLDLTLDLSGIGTNLVSEATASLDLALALSGEAQSVPEIVPQAHGSLPLVLGLGGIADDLAPEQVEQASGSLVLTIGMSGVAVVPVSPLLSSVGGGYAKGSEGKTYRMGR